MFSLERTPQRRDTGYGGGAWWNWNGEKTRVRYFRKNNIRVLPSSTLRTIISRATRGPKQPPKALKPFIAAAVASDWRQLVDSEIWRDSTFMAAFQKMVGFDIISRWASIWTLLKKILPLPGVCMCVHGESCGQRTNESTRCIILIPNRYRVSRILRSRPRCTSMVPTGPPSCKRQMRTGPKELCGDLHTRCAYPVCVRVTWWFCGEGEV